MQEELFVSVVFGGQCSQVRQTLEPVSNTVASAGGDRPQYDEAAAKKQRENDIRMAIRTQDRVSSARRVSSA